MKKYKCTKTCNVRIGGQSQLVATDQVVISDQKPGFFFEEVKSRIPTREFLEGLKKKQLNTYLKLGSSDYKNTKKDEMIDIILEG